MIMATPKKKAVLFSMKTSYLKKSNITKYFSSKSSEEDSLLSGKNHHTKETHTKPNYLVLNDTVVLMDSDDSDEQQMSRKDTEPREKDSTRKGVSATLPTVISSAASNVAIDEHSEKLKPCPNGKSLPQEKHNILCAFDSNSNSSNKTHSNLSKCFAKRNLPSPCKNVSSQSSTPTKVDSPRSQNYSPKCAEKNDSISGVKRKQLTLDFCFDSKKQKRERPHKDRSFFQSFSSMFGQHMPSGASSQRSFSNVTESTQTTIVDLTEGNVGQKEDCSKNGLVKKSDALIDLTRNEFVSLRKISSDSEVKSAEYETGYDSMTENTKAHASDDLADMYSLFENPAPEDSTANACMSSTDDVFPVYSNDLKEHIHFSRNSPPSEKNISFPSCRKSNISCCSNASSTDKGIGSDDERSFFDLIDADPSPEPNHSFSHEESITKEPSSIEDIPETKESQKEITSSTRLDKILNDKKKNESLKVIEEELLQYVKNGGFSRCLNEISDEDCDHDEDEYSGLERLISSTEDCQGLEERHKRVKLFSGKRQYFCYCPHSITSGENVLPRLLCGLDLRAQLNFINKNAKLVEQHIALHHQDEKAHMPARHVAEKSTSLMEWLLQVLATNTDAVNLKLAEAAYLSLSVNCNLEVNTTQAFYKAIANLGVRKKYCIPIGFSGKKSSTCQMCRSNAIHSFSAFRRLPFILRVLRHFLTRHPHASSDMELRHLVVLFLLLLSETQRDVHLHNLVSDLLIKIVDAVREWKVVRYLLVKDVINTIKDIHTLYHVVSVLPTTSQRSLELRRCIALALLRKHVEGVDIHHRLNGTDADNIEVIERLASQLTVGNVELMLKKHNPGATNLTVYNTLWFCVLLLQSCVGDMNAKCKENLEGITQSFRSLNLDIKENGNLYCSEIKHHIRLTTAVAEIHLHKMHKSQMYQTEIFKYLRAAKVKEEIVDVIDDTDSETDDTDSVSSFCKLDDNSNQEQLFAEIPIENMETISPHNDATHENVTYALHECPLRLKLDSNLQPESQSLSLPLTPVVDRAHNDSDLSDDLKEQVEFMKLLRLSLSDEANAKFFEHLNRQPWIQH